MDAIVTDPPYYNAIPYADLSDFFYVWLRRTIGDQYPEIFRTQLNTKDDELRCDCHIRKYRSGTHRQWYEAGMALAFRRAWEALMA